MNNFFLLLDALLLLFPFVFLADRKVFTIKMIVQAIIPSLAVTLIYAETGIFFSRTGAWQFNNSEISGLQYRSLPAEQYLYYFSLSFLCLAIYQYRKAKFAHKRITFALFVSNLLIGICIALLFFAYTKWYTLLTVGMAALLLLLVEYRSRLRFMGIFYPACLWGLIPFYGSQYFLSNRPVVSYQWEKTLDTGWVKIPFENHFLYLGMFLLGVFVLEAIQSFRKR